MICCQNQFGKTINGARKYGEYTCDFPLEGAKAQMKWFKDNLTEEKKPSLIVWTGDSLSHKVLGLKENDLYQSVRVLTQLLEETFPGTPILVTPGNHDFIPANL